MQRKFRTVIVALTVGLAYSPAASAAETITYVYDARGRLVQVTHSGSVNNGVQTTYTYDKTENRTNVTTTGA